MLSISIRSVTLHNLCAEGVHLIYGEERKATQLGDKRELHTEDIGYFELAKPDAQMATDLFDGKFIIDQYGIRPYDEGGYRAYWIKI